MGNPSSTCRRRVALTSEEVRTASLKVAAGRQAAGTITAADRHWHFLLNLILFARRAQETFHNKGEYLKAKTSHYARARLSEIWLGHRKGKLSGKAKSNDLTV